MIFLTALTLLGLTASADAVLQHQLASNLQETEHARQSAQAALEWTEDWLLELDNPPPRDCTAFCEGTIIHATGTLPAHPEFESLYWWTGSARQAWLDPLTGEHPASSEPNRPGIPLWMIEVLHKESSADSLQVWYRILVRGTGRTESGISVVESIVTKHWALPGNVDIVFTDPCLEPGPADTCGRLAWRELR